MKKAILLLMILFSVGCSQTKLPAYALWNQAYSPPNDSLSIVFDVFRLSSPTDTNWVKIDTSLSTQLRLLSYPNLYTNQNWWLFVRARNLNTGAISLNSDTATAFFPEIVADKPYQIQIIDVNVP